MSKTAAGADTNGSGKLHPAAAGRKAPAPRARDLRQARFAMSFSQVVAVLMRDPHFRKLRLADLEWLVLPPVMSGQFRLAQVPAPQRGGKPQQPGKAPDAGVLVPVAVALWARVSANTDKMLAANLDKQVRLHPADWASGDNLWLMAIAGDQRAMPKFLEQLRATEFKGKQVKMRLRGPDGKAVVRTLNSSSAKG